MAALSPIIAIVTDRVKPKSSAGTSFDRLALCRTLWSWPECSVCDAQQKSHSNCTTSSCPGSRLRALEAFFHHCEDAAISYIPEFLPGVPWALETREDIFRLISHIKRHSNLPQEELARHFFVSKSGSNGARPTEADQTRAFLTALRVMCMTDCSTINSLTSGTVIKGRSPTSLWSPTDSYENLWVSIFPVKECPELSDPSTSPIIKSSLSARKLVKIAGLQLRGTSDLRNHLRLDTKSGILEIYHHTSVLKEHLYETRDQPDVHGNVPRELALETLNTIYTILFPFADIGSQSILRRLIRKEGYDPDCRRSASTAYQRTGEDQLIFKYWGTRLMDLYDEVDDPTPRGYLERWLQRRSGARYVMMATLVGVAIAIILGILGLAVGIFQAWVAYQQWQHPLPT